MATSLTSGDSQLSDFRFRLDGGETVCGAPSVFLKSVVARPKDFGFICKKSDAVPSVGERLRLSASVMTSMPEIASAQLWLCIDSDWKQRPAKCLDEIDKDRIRDDSK